MRFPKLIMAVEKPVESIPNLRYLKRLARSKAEPVLPPHRHDAHQLEIIYVAEGQQDYNVSGRDYAMTGGDVLIIQPGEEHSSHGAPQGKALLYWLGLTLPEATPDFMGFSGDGARDLSAALRALRTTHCAGTPAMRKELDTALWTLERRAAATPLWKACAQGHLVLFLSDLVACAGKQPRRNTDPWTRSVVAYMERCLTDTGDESTLTVSRLAKHFGFSRIHFTRRFEQGTGIPPAQYILRRRIDLTKDIMLRHPDRPITDIAFQFGFSSSNNFATIFKRFMSMTPREFRRQALSGPAR